MPAFLILPASGERPPWTLIVGRGFVGWLPLLPFRGADRTEHRLSSCDGPPPGRHPPGDLTWVICVDEDRIVEMRAYFDGGLVEELFRTTER
jgi:hypothetical protein